MNKIDVIVPVLNEAENLTELVNRIGKSLKTSKIPYGIIVVDDHSTDDTHRVLKQLSAKYPITILFKHGSTGKAYSLLEGTSISKAEYVVMIDGDLQYAPEYIPEMFKIAEKDNLGVVIGNRKVHHESKLRQFVSKVGHTIYAKFILGMNSDTQSGLKLFRREIASFMETKDLKPWAFDIPLIHTANQLGYKVGSVDIDFQKRKNGKSKISLVKGTFEILSTAISLKLKPHKAYHLPPESTDSMVGAGVIYKKKKFITHTTLHHSKSALITFTFIQKAILFTSVALLIGGLIVNPQLTAIIFIAILSAIYFLDVFFGLFLVLKSLHYPPEMSFDQKRLDQIKDKYLPTYSILCPLYREAHVLPQFVENISKMDWPKDKLDVILLLEEDDKETIEIARKMNLPSYFRILVVPDSLPKTKPKACNYGLAHAKGEFVVIYDAEDQPEPEQLKKAFLGFMDSPLDVFCLQAKLNYYNPNQNILTRLFTAEYSLWFDIVLPGLQSIQTSIPLGGTSNHFRTAGLRKLEGWDPFNVAEDADLGARLFRAGYKTAIIDSITLEEANSSVPNWIRQRSRWLKGYMQTYFVQMRHPITFAREKKQHYFIFQLVNGLRVSFMVINPFLWAMTLAYFLLYRFVGPQIEALYPTSVFYMAAFSIVFGNFLYLYYYMIGAAKRNEWGIIKYIFLVPLYWLMTSIGAFVAFYQLLVKPHFWEKTIHGLDLNLQKNDVKTKYRLYYFKNILNVGIKNTTISSAFILIIATVINYFFNFLYNAYLGRNLTIVDFGAISFFGSLMYLLSIITSGISRTMTYKSAYISGKLKGPVKAYWQKIFKKGIAYSLTLTLVWIVLSPFTKHLFKIEGISSILMFSPLIVVAIANSINEGFINGNLKFNTIALMITSEAVSKFVLSFLLVQIHQTHLVVLALPLSIAISFAAGLLTINKIKPRNITKTQLKLFDFPIKFFMTGLLARVSSVAFLSLDLILAKKYLTPTDAGRYAIISLVGKMIFFSGSIFNQFITPFVSKHVGANKNPLQVFHKILFGSLVSCVVAYLVFGFFGKYTATILLGSKAESIAYLLPIFGIAMVFFTLSEAYIPYHIVRGHNIFPFMGLVLAITEILAFSHFHNGLESLIYIMTILGSIYFGTILLIHSNYEIINNFKASFADFFEIFNLKSPKVYLNQNGRKRILIFNWRDTKHVWSGGAEVYIHEIAKRLVKKGHKVTIFCGNDSRCARNEVVDGVQIIRRGGFYTVYIWAFLYYTLRLKDYFDVIVDSENGVPFFTPLYSKKKIFLLIHHVHQDLFRIKLHPPFSWIGKFLEKEVMPWVYRNTEVITVSPSSKADILEHKITNKEPYVIYNGVDMDVYKPGKKSVNPMVLYLGRLTPQKSLSVLIRSAKDIVAKIPKVEIVIAGDGQDKSNLIKLTKKLGLSDNIKFLGKVTQEEKVKLYQQAWVFVNPSLIEGWGITTIEANACGTPVVASNVAGLRDSVHNPHSGLLVPYGNIDEFAKSTILLLKNRGKRETMGTDSVKWAKKFNWDKSTSSFAILTENNYAH